MSCVAGMPNIDTFYGWDYTSDLRYSVYIYNSPPDTGGVYTRLAYANTEQEASFAVPITKAGSGYNGVPGDTSIHRVVLSDRYFFIKPRVFIAPSLDVQRLINLTLDIETTDEIFEIFQPWVSDSYFDNNWATINIRGDSGPPYLGKRVVVRCNIATYAIDANPDWVPALSVIPIGFPFTVTCVFE